MEIKQYPRNGWVAGWVSARSLNWWKESMHHTSLTNKCNNVQHMISTSCTVIQNEQSQSVFSAVTHSHPSQWWCSTSDTRCIALM